MGGRARARSGLGPRDEEAHLFGIFCAVAAAGELEPMNRKAEEAFLEAQIALAREGAVAREGAPFQTATGTSEDAYLAAFQGCVPDDGFGRGKDRAPGVSEIQRALRSLDPNKAGGGSSSAPGQACEALGAPAERVGAAHQALGEESCALILSCQTALPKIREGSHAASSLSPLHAWSEWRLDEEGFRSLGPWMALGQVALAHSLLVEERPQTALDAVAVLRMGQDLAIGADGRVARTGVRVQHVALDALVHIVGDPGVSAESLRPAMLELEYAATHAPALAPISRVDFLEGTAFGWSVAYPGDDLQARFPVGYQSGQKGLEVDDDTLPPGAKPAFKRFLSHLHLPAWQLLLPQLEGGTHRSRAEVVGAWMVEVESGDHGALESLLLSTSTGLGETQIKTDAQQAGAAARACMVAFAIRLRLDEADQGPCTRDPYTGEPWQMTTEAGWISLWSLADEAWRDNEGVRRGQLWMALPD